MTIVLQHLKANLLPLFSGICLVHAPLVCVNCELIEGYGDPSYQLILDRILVPHLEYTKAVNEIYENVLPHVNAINVGSTGEKTGSDEQTIIKNLMLEGAVGWSTVWHEVCGTVGEIDVLSY